MVTLPVEPWIGKAAAALRGVWGAVTRHAEQSGSSRTTIYKHAERVGRAVAHAQASGSSDETLWTANKRLQAEHEALWPAWSEVDARSAPQQRALGSAGSAMGVSLRPLVTLLALVLPRGVVPSRATGGRGVSQSAAPASRIVRGLEQACQRWGLR